MILLLFNCDHLITITKSPFFGTQTLNRLFAHLTLTANVCEKEEDNFCF